ncbi:MAG: hypothetical protein ACKO4A_05585, partial [Gammaproteobacteria bacterium]
ASGNPQANRRERFDEDAGETQGGVSPEASSGTRSRLAPLPAFQIGLQSRAWPAPTAWSGVVTDFTTGRECNR